MAQKTSVLKFPIVNKTPINPFYYTSYHKVRKVSLLDRGGISLGRLTPPGSSHQFPVLKFIKGLGPCLHTVQIASYEKNQPLDQKEYIQISKFPKFGYVSRL